MAEVFAQTVKVNGDIFYTGLAIGVPVGTDRRSFARGWFAFRREDFIVPMPCGRYFHFNCEDLPVEKMMCSCGDVRHCVVSWS